MEHTLEAYLARRSTDVLEQALQCYCASERNLKSNKDAVELILKELKKRYNNPEGEQPPHIQAAWKAYQRHLTECAQDI